MQKYKHIVMYSYCNKTGLRLLLSEFLRNFVWIVFLSVFFRSCFPVELMFKIRQNIITNAASSPFVSYAEGLEF